MSTLIDLSFFFFVLFFLKKDVLKSKNKKGSTKVFGSLFSFEKRNTKSLQNLLFPMFLLPKIKKKQKLQRKKYLLDVLSNKLYINCNKKTLLYDPPIQNDPSSSNN